MSPTSGGTSGPPGGRAGPPGPAGPAGPRRSGSASVQVDENLNTFWYNSN